MTHGSRAEGSCCSSSYDTPVVTVWRAGSTMGASTLTCTVSATPATCSVARSGTLEALATRTASLR